MRKMKSLLGAAAAAVLLASPMMASADTVVLIAGSPKTTTGLTGFATTGALMDGMLVTAAFSGGGSETLAWADIAGAPGNDGGVFGSGWSLKLVGNSFDDPWTLTSTVGITSLLFDGIPGKTVFDTRFPFPGGNGDGTPDSARGWQFQRLSGGPTDITTTYSDILNIGTDPAVGDLYTKVSVVFREAFGGPTAVSTMTFRMDTDNALVEIRDVPEPASCTLLAIGAAGLVGYRARRRKLNAA